MNAPAWQALLIEIVASFLIGSIPFGLFVTKAFHGADIRKTGSGNVGATNVTRVAGFFPAGLITLVLDVAKGVVPVVLVQQEILALALPGAFDYHSAVGGLSAWLAGLATVLGHCYTPWLHFRGGKGVATAFGIFLVLSPISAIVGAASFALMFRDTRIGSLSSLSAALMCMTTLAVLNREGDHLFAAAAILFVILLRHESNMDAILEGRENVFR